MAKFICPVNNCKYWSRKKENCKKKVVVFEPRSDDFDVTLACPHQNTEKRENAQGGW